MQLRHDIEPGILPTFRLFVGIMWLLMSLGLLGFGLRVSRDAFFLLAWPVYGALLAYLAWPVLRPRLGAVFLPVGLLVATLWPMLADALAAVLNRRFVLPETMLRSDSGRLYLWLIPPLLLIAMQYGLRAVLGFTLLTTLLPPLLAIVVDDRGSLFAYASHALLRCMLFLLVGFFVARIGAAQRAGRQELAVKNAQLAQYAAAQEELATSRERTRLARELHDTLAHTLSAVNIQLKALEVQLESEPAAARATLRQTQELTRTGLNEARRALHALRARPIEELGLVEALRRQAELIAGRAGFQLQFSAPPQLSGQKLELEQQLYRIAEEALNNVARHARARHVHVALQQHNGTLHLTIADDGVGFEVAHAHSNGHYGLNGMHERAQLIGGKLAVESEPGQGTRVTLTIGD
ncbi:MAG: sensor histidine kinase [Chloroflexaceae bacterium]|jgi:signal transduction histidine kinase|nr:sensor histidine kinase [Chloroflexaceae bacterium]